MTERGFIAIARGILDHPVVGVGKSYSDFEAWVWLLFEAAYVPRRISVTNGRARGVLQLERGQLSHSRSYMAKAWGWSEKRVRTFLYRLEMDRQIGRQTGQLQTVITICNYELYQKPLASRGQQTGQQTDRQRAGNGPEEEQGNKVTIDDDGDARPEWQLSEAFDLAKQISQLAGRAGEFEISGWGGATLRVKTWLDQGWAPELILASVSDQAAKKRDGPARTINYFEQGIAAAIARQNSPLPTVEPMPAKPVEANNGNRGNVIPAADRLVERVRALDRPASAALCSGQGETSIRLLSQGGR